MDEIDFPTFNGEPSEAPRASPLKRVSRGDVDIRVGDHVRLHPLGRADVFDLALDGKLATVVSIEQDYEDRIHVAVTVDDDPGRELGTTGQPGHRFFFGVEEVEPAASTDGSSECHSQTRS